VCIKLHQSAKNSFIVAIDKGKKTNVGEVGDIFFTRNAFSKECINQNERIKLHQISKNSFILAKAVLFPSRLTLREGTIS